MGKKIKLKDIINFLGEDIISLKGDYTDLSISSLNAPEKVNEFTLEWINQTRKDKQLVAEKSKAKAIIVGEDILYTNTLKEQNKVLIVVKNPKLAITKIGNYFFVKKPKPGIHPTAFVNPIARIGDDVHVGPNSTIGKCKIGYNVVIYPNVTIFDDVIIGNNSIIKAGAVLGSEGFGFEKDENGELVKFPQLGKLIIKDKVEIGANTCIDKGALTDTVIGYNTKINNLCHIAHNVKIGNNVIITAHVNISGSTIIEDNVWIAPNSSLRGHHTIGKGAVVGMGAVVTKNVPAGETWVGNPAKKFKAK